MTTSLSADGAETEGCSWTSAITSSASPVLLCEDCGCEVGAVDGGENERDVAWVAEGVDEVAADRDSSETRAPAFEGMYGGEAGVVG